MISKPGSSLNNMTGDNSSHIDTPWCGTVDYQYDIAASVVYSLCCIAGVVYTFFGYRIYRVSLAATGFAFTAFFLYIACLQHTPHVSHSIRIAISVTVGIIGAIVSILLQPVGRFLIGSHIGIAIVTVLFIIVGQFVAVPSPWIPIGILATVWLTFGAATFKSEKNFLIVGTATLGAALMVGCLDHFIEKSRLSWCVYAALNGDHDAALVRCWYSWLVLACWPFTCVVGSAIQLRVTGYSFDHVAEVQELRQRKVQKLNLQKLRTAAQHDRQQSHYRHLYQVRRVHGDVISQTFIKNVQEHQDKQKSCSPPPSTPTVLSPETITCVESAHTTLSHVP